MNSPLRLSRPRSLRPAPRGQYYHAMDGIRIDIERYTGIVFLTGAGISAASGIRTYRGPDGLWNDETLVRLSDGETFKTDPLDVWKFWSEARKITAAASPNAAHFALAALEERLVPGRKLTIITQNIDGLHGRAGSSRVIEYHGNVHRTRCSNEACGQGPFEDRSLYQEEVPRCPLCGSNLRPDIVLFNEMIPARASTDALHALADCDLFVAVGTSATVYPANTFVRGAFERGARTVYMNLESLGDENAYFKEECLGRAEEILPLIFGEKPPRGTE
jgi:NAD-dependent deacetylase